MGEYARYDILERFGVDIGDDDDEPPKKKEWKWPCRLCGKRLGSEVANRDHMRDKHKKLAAEYQRDQIASAQSEAAFKANQEAYSLRK